MIAIGRQLTSHTRGPTAEVVKVNPEIRATSMGYRPKSRDVASPRNASDACASEEAWNYGFLAMGASAQHRLPHWRLLSRDVSVSHGGCFSVVSHLGHHVCWDHSSVDGSDASWHFALAASVRSVGGRPMRQTKWTCVPGSRPCPSAARSWLSSFRLRAAKKSKSRRPLLSPRTWPQPKSNRRFSAGLGSELLSLPKYQSRVPLYSPSQMKHLVLKALFAVLVLRRAKRLHNAVCRENEHICFLHTAL